MMWGSSETAIKTDSLRNLASPQHKKTPAREKHTAQAVSYSQDILKWLLALHSKPKQLVYVLSINPRYFQLKQKVPRSPCVQDQSHCPITP